MSIINPIKDSCSIRGKVVDVTDSWPRIELGATQVDVSFSRTGSLQRKLKLKVGDKVVVSITKVK